MLVQLHIIFVFWFQQLLQSALDLCILCLSLKISRWLDLMDNKLLLFIFLWCWVHLYRKRKMLMFSTVGGGIYCNSFFNCFFLLNLIGQTGSKDKLKENIFITITTNLGGYMVFLLSIIMQYIMFVTHGVLNEW